MEIAERSFIWNPPLPHYVKINFDAVVRKEKTCAVAVGPR